MPIDLAISGHTHRYHEVPVGVAGNAYPVLIGGGPNRFRGAPVKADENKDPVETGGDPKAGAGIVMILSATDEHLSVEVLDESGTTVGKYEMLSNALLKLPLGR